MQLALLAFLPEITPKTPDFGRTWTRNAAARSELDATFRVLRLYDPIGTIRIFPVFLSASRWSGCRTLPQRHNSEKMRNSRQNAYRRNRPYCPIVRDAGLRGTIAGRALQFSQIKLNPI
jgi:hypothetical protein